MSHKLFELDVRLREIEPPVWRTLEVPGTSSLEDLHFAIQVAMGWTNSHLHQFEIDDSHYGMVDIDEAGDLEDERQHCVQDLVESGRSFVYEYDFGDGWEHDVRVLTVTTVTKAPRARRTAGERACPPEDCGGPGGYANLLQALADPKHEEHESLMWSDGFKPERFALPKNGRDLQAEMSRLKAVGDRDEVEDRGDAEGPLADLPRVLVQAVLALPPLARASLAAVIAGSLADDVEHARSIVDQLAAAKHADKRPRHSGRSKSARS